MSFGFSIGDIILIGQLSYRLYDILSTDNGPPAQELGNALFGLRCALDHLGRQATEISHQAGYDENQTAGEMHRNLDKMIASCAALLTEIEDLFAKYAIESQGNSGLGPHIPPRAVTSTRDKLRLSLSRLQNTLKTGSLRMRWSKDSKLFAEYREKLQSHADAINMVLTTFLWSSSQRIEKASSSNAEKVQRIENASSLNAEKVQLIQEQVQHSNAELLSLVNGIHAMVSKSSQDAVQTDLMLLDDQGSMPNFSAGYRGLSVQAHFANSAPKHVTPLRKRRHESSTLMAQHSKAVAPSLSTHLVEINRSRSAIGREQLLRFRRQNCISDAMPKLQPETDPNSFFRVDHPTVSQVAMELEKIVSKLNSKGVQTRSSNEIMTQRLHRWLQGFEAVVNSWPSRSAGTKVEKQQQQKDGHALMVELNLKLSQANGIVKKQIYLVLDRNGIDRIFEKLREKLGAVMVEKEIQTYEDERETLE